MESNSLKCSSIQTVHSIEFKFDMHIIGHVLHIVSNLVNLGLIVFLQEYRKEFLYITAYGVKL